MARKRIEKPTECYLCGRNGAADPLDKHHVFGGPFRSKSDRYGAVVYLCHERCHLFGPHSVHRDVVVSHKVRADFQQSLMEQHGWTVEQFIKEFGQNYMED